MQEILDCLHRGKVWELVSVFHGGGRDSRICAGIFENDEDPVSVIARIRQWLTFVVLAPSVSRSGDYSASHEADPIHLPHRRLAQGTLK